MDALSYGYQKLFWKSKSHVINLKHWRVFITFNIAVPMVRCSGKPYKHFLLNLFPYILNSWAKEAYCFRIFFNLELYQEKTPPQMFQAFLAENGSVKYNQATLSSQTPQTYFESSSHVQISNSSYQIFFREKYFPNNIHALDTVFTDAKNSNIF